MINAIKYSREIIMFEFLSVTIIMFASLSGNMKSNNFLSPSDSRTLVPSYVYTPNNTLVNTWDRSDEELSLSEVTYYNNYISSHYPNAIFISNATRIYNCHSYAWYMQSSQHNKHWMDSPSNYILDNSYYQVVASPQIGDIICYINSDGSKIHSGRIENIFPGTSNNVCGSSNLYQVISKWGIYGLYSHRGDECLYTSYNSEAYGENLAITVVFYRVSSSHTHSWTFVPHNNYQHAAYCSCSEVVYENHVWISINKNQDDKSIPLYLCQICGKISIYPY